MTGRAAPRAALVGAGGPVGRAAAHELHAAGYGITEFADVRTAGPPPPAPPPPGWVRLTGDIEHMPVEAALRGCAALVEFSGSGSGHRALRGAARRAGVRRLVRSVPAAAAGTGTAVLRRHPVYGPGIGDGEPVMRLLAAALGGGPVELVGLPRVLAPAFAPDTARLHRLAVERGLPGGGAEASGGVQVTLDELVDLVTEAAGRAPRVRLRAVRPHPPPPGRDLRGGWSALGYRPSAGLAEGLRRTAEWIGGRETVAG
ncbi:hypothetical protein O4J56_20210 [Nocardiopsis sp. RSe5-2]|uniref:Uncharacterized protein n=1 Tax=Nocardiopsis endophytica TaxID=3018445 RepID=A0ABT4U7Q2_9ACTN|nr:hypothetical protein [Nocardiopsis endophytica]MDA2812980.1 hypothetical protein [Nocardiopsis endophytica]